MSESQDALLPENYDEILAVLTTALNQLAEICTAGDAGLALGLAGLKELRDEDDDLAAVAAYKQLFLQMQEDLTRRLPARH